MAQQQSREATLAQQKACADQARAKFHEDGYASLSPPGSYTNHYDPQTNVCYVMVLTVTHGRNDSLLGNRKVYDAFEGQVYGVMTIVMFRVARLSHGQYRAKLAVAVSAVPRWWYRLFALDEGGLLVITPYLTKEHPDGKSIEESSTIRQ
jgi:hypothetical protein